MSLSTTSPFRRRLAGAGALLLATAVLAGCTSNDPEDSGDDAAEQTQNAGSSNDDTGETVTIGFSGPEADHGWLAAINQAAQDEAAKYDDIDFKSAEGTNDANLQISQIETFINDKVDAIAAVVIGGTLLSGGRGTIVGTVFGVLIFTTLSNVFTLNDVGSSNQAVAKGAIIIIAVLLQQRVAARQGAP